MPPQRDLTGSRFGSLTVLRADGRVFWGRDQTAWLCRCDCGAVIRVPQKRLTSSAPSHQLHACDGCRSTPCEICGTPVPPAARAKTCSPECRAEKDRRYQLAYYHSVRTQDPEDTEKRRQRKREKWASMTPEERLADSRKRAATQDPEAVRRYSRELHRHRMETDPDYAAAKAAAREKWLAAHPETAKRYSRDYARRRRAKMAEIDMMRVKDALTETDNDE